MQYLIKPFFDLSLQELYALLALRNEVFIIEQDCPYQDVDGKDQFAWHVMVVEDGKLLGYARVLPPGKYFAEWGIGRVVVGRVARRRGLARNLMLTCIQFIQEQNEQFNEPDAMKIKVSAQTYLNEFYSSLGFRKQGEEYLEDGLAHQAMFLNLEQL